MINMIISEEIDEQSRIVYDDDGRGKNNNFGKKKFMMVEE